MSPTLCNGDYIVIIKPRSIRAGLIFVINHPRLGCIVKRLETIGESELWFKGDNPISTSSLKIGPVQQEMLRGRAILAITPKGIKRL